MVFTDQSSVVLPFLLKQTLYYSYSKKFVRCIVNKDFGLILCLYFLVSSKQKFTVTFLDELRMVLKLLRFVSRTKNSYIHF